MDCAFVIFREDVELDIEAVGRITVYQVASVGEVVAYKLVTANQM